MTSMLESSLLYKNLVVNFYEVNNFIVTISLYLLKTKDHIGLLGR